MKYRSQLLNSTVPDTTNDKNTHQNGTDTGLFTDGITDIGAIVVQSDNMTGVATLASTSTL